jgi:predicted oxidoreductase
MKTIKLGKTGLDVPAIAVGCMRINKLSALEAERFVAAALDMGANFFDHADIYGGNACEEIFAQAIHLNPTVREKIILQSKCGIVPGKMFDFSQKHILESVNGSLKRLNTDYLDVLLLHRPDALVEPEEVAAAFDELQKSGKVRHFGVSNQNAMQIQLLRKCVKQPIAANQLQFSAAHAGLVTQGIHVNMLDDGAVDRNGGILDFCRLNDITIQTWSPFQAGFFGGVFLDNPQFVTLNQAIDEIAGTYGVSNTTIAMAWILRHPAHMQPVTGTMNITRLKDCVKATEITLSREEWYRIYLAAGNILP